MAKDHDVGRVIKQLSNLFDRRLQELREEIEGTTNITGLQGWIIGYLKVRCGKQDVFQKDIENELKIGRSTATALLQRMEKNGLIVREVLPGDARWKKIILTPRVLELCSKRNTVKEKMESKITKGLTGEELTTFFRVVEKIIRNLE